MPVFPPLTQVIFQLSHAGFRSILYTCKQSILNTEVLQQITGYNTQVVATPSGAGSWGRMVALDASLHTIFSKDLHDIGKFSLRPPSLSHSLPL